MIAHLSHVMTLANSIIGVSVLAMPFCFKQCGIILATLVLLVSSVLSRLACHFLIKSAVMSRRRNFEFLAFHAFGPMGKFLVELFIIGFLLGTCIAFFVVVGDLGPQIVGKMLNKNPGDIRTSLLVTTGAFIVLPLGLLRNIDSLSSVCTATIGFYLCLVVKVIGESTQHIFTGDWYDNVVYWRPAGILQCLPIFAMALFCQTQLFEIYEAIPNVCLDKMNQVVRGALNICTIVYLCVGFFGYIAFCTQPFTGNILMSFEPSLTSDIIKMGFVFSVAFSFPLVIFPCRASLNSLLFRRAHTHEPSNYYIPEMRFRCLTFTIVAISLGTGILIPNIELVLGIVGSTIGVMICLIFPAAFFIAISSKNTNERLIAQAILFFGMWIMVLGTYANLYAMEESTNTRLGIITEKPMINQINNIPINNLLRDGFPLVPQIPKDAIVLEEVKEKLDEPRKKSQEKNAEAIDVRREPPIPVERSAVTERLPIESKNLGANLVVASMRPEIEKMVNQIKILDNNLKNSEISKAAAVGELSKDVHEVVVNKQAAPIQQNPEEKEMRNDQQRNENLIDSDAIRKEESELAAAGDQADIEAAARREKLRQTLEKHKLEQLEMMQEQKEILKDIKEQKQEFEMEKKMKRLAMEQSKKNDEFERTDIKSKEPKKNSAIGNIVDNKGSILKPIDQKENEAAAQEISSLNNNREKISDLANKSSQNEAVKSNNNLSLSKIGLEESHGPILNALTNWTSRINGSKDENEKLNKKTEIIDNLNNRDGQQVDDINKIVKKPSEFALPIALHMRNQTKLSVVRQSLLQTDKSTDDGLSIRRDILERRDREKRDIVENREIVPQDNEKSKDIVNVLTIDNEQCERTSSEKSDTKTTSIPAIEIDIKTVVYLAEQGFTEKILSLDPGNVGGEQVNMPKLKKRDLKALRQGH